MNILFANYGDYTTNSLNHIGGFAGWLSERGHACIVAVPSGRESFSAVHQPRFIAATFAEVLAGTVGFPDGRPADVLHAWTPRETVRTFILAHQRRHPATRVIVHLEDNEQHLASAFTGKSVADLAAATDDTLDATLPGALTHPHRGPALLAAADGATVIIDSLRNSLPGEVPALTLPPGVDFSLYQPRPADPAKRHALGLALNERVIVYTGSTTFANAQAVASLLRAVHQLRRDGLSVRLIRTGYHPAEFSRELDFDWAAFTLDLGFLPKADLPGLLALADVLVQPGSPGAFDDFRLPSKLPEFLASGRPVIMPAVNLGLQVTDGVEALLLRSGDAAEIAAQCKRILNDAGLAHQLGEAGRRFARAQFDPDRIGATLLAHYQACLARPSRAPWTLLAAEAHASEAALQPALIRDRLLALLPADSPAAAILREATESLTSTLLRLEAGAANSVGQAVREKLTADIARLNEQLALGGQHAANLTAALDQARRAQAALEASYADFRATTTQRIRELEGISATLHRQVYNFQAELVRTTAEAAQRLHEETARRDAKIRRMQESFSWQATAPLRALRRQFLDGGTKPEPAVVPVVPAPKANPVRCQIDEPHFWHLPAGAFVVRGWALLPDERTPSNVRIRVGGREFAGQAGLARPDVAAVLGADVATRCGFKVELVVEAGSPLLVLEAADEAGHWHPLVEKTLTVFHPAMPPEVESYARWLHLYDPVSAAALQTLREEAAALVNPPLISVVMPVYNAPERWLRRAIESVRDQVYPHWELCIADDASTAPHVRPLLESYSAADSRIKVVFRPVNGHISASSNSALEIAQGAYVALLDHDDELSPRALARMAIETSKHPAAVFLYSDEDKIDEQGHRFDPYFKPDFLPDLLLGQNCLSHLSVIQTDAVRAVGGFRVGLEGSQDWDLALRVVADLAPDRIRHVPEILYHWRAIAGSTALAVGEKSYTVRAAERALRDHLEHRGLAAALEPVPGDHWRVHYQLPSAAPLVSLIIPTRDRLALTRTCVESILAKTDYARYEILILDNDSVEPATLAWFADVQARDARVKVLRYPHPFNYSALNNFGVKQATGEIIGLLNNDLEVITPGWLTEMVSHAVRPEIGAVGAMLYYPNDTIQHAGIILGLGGVANHAFYRYPRGTDGYKNRARLVQNFSAVTGACLLVRKAVYEQVGGLNADQLAVAFNDVDFCLKVRAAGYLNTWTPFAELYHHESASRGSEDTPEKLARFAREVDYMRRTWGAELDNDPAYNQNFSLDIEGFKLASPPRRKSS
ncbi:MAG TPA: glycosyltransferase [Opitutaceae bacterium]